ncbi:ras and Rab interactor 1-like isoform X1 [Takifugu flavidus]|uniref:Ras and n=1 Tax=Takifugu flavidus TaxID=433684 RepID=A0A5C6P6J1_9TELE|nr:ras and Rab interactor 1-like isoform X1 [Takifugu flavidus]XP_056911425.1 ras and Rab interactor 1-like isoform X1 [Takifugu flavidus]XP_056911426.1 ras and Rab interactor 1-like isoform X1 [Takifugu flavidus]TWW74508.1 Ras and [Takifugu flavidus]
MAQQQEPLYDFPEPAQPSGHKFAGHHRGRGSLKSISVLDRLLLTVPVWFQLSINPATALHILQREPPGTFLVRKSRTSQRNVLCVRLADESVPSFVQQFGIREEQSTLSLETSAISFPDLPRLVSFYCVSRDVLPFPLELPEAIAKATSHKELESISHMGIEFWNSHLNVRGPREAPLPQKDQEKPGSISTAPPGPAPQTSASPQSDSAPRSDSDSLSNASKAPAPGLTLFHEFCPIKTRSPRELDCGSGQGALCFINPLFRQMESPLLRRRMFKRSLKVRVSTETSTLLSPPLAPPPPPPLMPKSKGKSKGLQEIQGQCKASQIVQKQTEDNASEPPPPTPHIRLQQEQSPTQASSQLPAIMEQLPDNSDYMQPSPVISSFHPPSLSPYFSPSAPSLTPQAFPKAPSPLESPSLSPYQSPSLSPKMLSSMSLQSLPNVSPSLFPYQFPSLSPLIPSNSSCTSLSFPPFTAPLTIDQQGSDKGDEEAIAGIDCNDEGGEINGDDGRGLLLQMDTVCLKDAESCCSYIGQERVEKSRPPQSNETRLKSD